MKTKFYPRRMIFFFLGYTTAKPDQFALQDGGSVQALNALTAVFGLFTRSIFHLFFISLFQVLNIHMVILVQLSILPLVIQSIGHLVQLMWHLAMLLNFEILVNDCLFLKKFYFNYFFSRWIWIFITRRSNYPKWSRDISRWISFVEIYWRTSLRIKWRMN